MKNTKGRRLFVAAAAALALTTALAGGASASSKARAATPDVGLIKAGTLTVGMTLQFAPEMYIDKKTKQPAGYDVELVTALAKAMGVKLDIKNLGFDGLIPGLVAKKFDLVSVGLSATPERKKAIDFTRAYVPYALILAVPTGDTTPATYPAWNDSSKTITSLKGSTDETLVKTVFPKAKSSPFPDDTAALLQVATGRADAAVIENYLLAAVLEDEPRQAQGGGVQEAAERAVRLVGRAEGQQRVRQVPEHVPLQDPGQRHDGVDLQEDRGRRDPPDAQVLM